MKDLEDQLKIFMADALDLPQPLGLLLDDVEHRLSERPPQPLAVDGTYAPDHGRTNDYGSLVIRRNQPTSV